MCRSDSTATGGWALRPAGDVPRAPPRGNESAFGLEWQRLANRSSSEWAEWQARVEAVRQAASRAAPRAQAGPRPPEALDALSDLAPTRH